jgi:riboflavin biosynthesis pyrimidine reductase
MSAAATPDRAAGDGWRIASPLVDPEAAAAPAPGGPIRGGVLPPALAARYGAALAIPLRADRPSIVANFVTTIDGIVALDTMGRTGGREVSGSSEPDRFLMGLLRSTADAVLVGAGTVRSGSGHVWTPDHVHRASAEAYAAWRRELGLAPQPTTVIVTESGRIEPTHPGISRPDVPVLIVTTPAGAEHLGRLALPAPVEVEVAGDGQGVDPAALVSILARRGFSLVLCEGGPTLFGGLVGAGLVDELFLTVAPHLGGRSRTVGRLALVEGQAFEIGETPQAELRSVLRSGSHLFLRYRLAGTSPVAPRPA